MEERKWGENAVSPSWDRRRGEVESREVFKKAKSLEGACGSTPQGWKTGRRRQLLFYGRETLTSWESGRKRSGTRLTVRSRFRR